HWAFHDPSMNIFNYYRYSDKFYHLLFDTKFEYQSRMVKSEWLPIFRRAGLRIIDYHPDISDDSTAIQFSNCCTYRGRSLTD
ncbi:MAG: hypothetical protein JO270_27095, partial [Acidobacteriaceae bacterium]|nr:hypothetical protein [Acidobacteriaceae bacterium]